MTTPRVLGRRMGVQAQPSLRASIVHKTRWGPLSLAPFERLWGREFHQDQISESGLVLNYLNSDSKYIGTVVRNPEGNQVCLVARLKSFLALFREEL